MANISQPEFSEQRRKDAYERYGDPDDFVPSLELQKSLNALAKTQKELDEMQAKLAAKPSKLSPQ